MKGISTDKLRNIALIGHVGTGKTTFLESLLYHAGAIHHQGSTEKGDTQSDHDHEEIKRKISIHITPAIAEHKSHKINILDTPGTADFCIDAYSALHIAENAIFFVDAEIGVQIETERYWMHAEGTKNIRMIVINKMDKDGANFKERISEIETKLETSLTPLFIPIGAGSKFQGVIDLVSQKAYYPGEKPNKPRIEDVPKEYQSDFGVYREKLVESACEGDDTLMEKFLEGGALTDAEVIQGLRKAIATKKVVPVACAAPEKKIGLNPILDFIVDFLCDPTLHTEVKGNDPTKEHSPEMSIKATSDAPFSAIIFKTIIDQYIGRLSYFKVMSGTLSVNDTVYNPRTQSNEKIAHLFYVKGKEKEDVESVATGDIASISKMSKALTNDTICSPDKPIFIKPFKMAQPISFHSIKSQIKGDEEKLNEQLFRLMEQDPSFKVAYNAETHQTVISCMGEIQNEIYLSRIKEKLPNIEFEMGIPRIAYRETIRKPSDALYRHKKQSGGHGQFGEVHIKIEKAEPGQGLEFVNAIVGGVVPKNYIPGVEKGLKDAMGEGVIAHFPVMDIKVTLDDGKYHSVDSSEMAFRIAAKQALKDAMKKADPVLLEPIMKSSIFVPESYTGSILNDLNGKRAQILGIEKVKGSIQCVQANVPLVEMLHYSIDLKSITSGSGTFEMEFSHYNELTGRLADKVVEERAAVAKEEEE